MKVKTFCKIGLIVGLLLGAFGMSTYAANITSVTGSDGTNTFATSEDALTAETPLSSTLSISGKTDSAKANVTLMIEAEDTVVYLNQTVADSDGNFSFSFPVALEKGYVYTVKTNTEGSETAGKMYFKTAAKDVVRYGDVDGNKSLTNNDAVVLAKYMKGSTQISDTVKNNVEAGLGNVDASSTLTSNDIVALLKYMKGSTQVSSTVKERLAWTQTTATE